MSGRRIAVVGAGVVGLSAAYQLIKAGARVTLFDPAPEGDKASFGNAGGIAVTEVMPASAPGIFWRAVGWMLDPLGPIAVRPAHSLALTPWLARFAKVGGRAEVERIAQALATINGRVYDDLIPMLADAGLSGELHRMGALSVYESEEGFSRDAAEWRLKRAHGIEIEELSGEEARAMEPALGPLVKRGVFTPQWSHVGDPKRLVDGLRGWLVKQGLEIRAAEVSSLAPDGPAVSLQIGGESVSADGAVVAAGAWSGRLARSVGDRVLLESERGYNMTVPKPGVALRREVIFAERKFVATPLDCGLRIGGAAEFGGLDAAPNFKRAHALVELASRYLPGLTAESGTPWAGHRPATPDSLPVIGRSPRHRQIVYAFGHGHLGLTQAATTGRLVRELIFDETPSIDLAPFGIGRFG